MFLNNDTVVAEGWLDELVAPLVRTDVGAVGPRSDNVSGHQATAAVRYSPDQPGAFTRSVRAWRNQHRGQTTDVRRLVGFCLAVRRDAFVRIGGFDERYGIGGFEDDDLCVRLTQLGLRLLVAHGSFVHHHGHATFDANEVDWRRVQDTNRQRFVDEWGSQALPRAPLVSACLIVKDEEAMLADCLESLRDLTGEVVVYDTGSSDATIQIARAGGARVIEGQWEDSFAQARNVALAHAAGEWVLSIDADERLRADPEAVQRQLLDPATEVEAYLVAIENLHGAGNPARYTAPSGCSVVVPAAGCTGSTNRSSRPTILDVRSGPPACPVPGSCTTGMRRASSTRATRASGTSAWPKLLSATRSSPLRTR